MNWAERTRAVYAKLADDPDYLTAEFLTAFMDEVCRRMDELGMTQSQLAERLGATQAYVAKVLNHHPNMKMRSFFKLLAALDLKLDGIRLVDKRTGAQFTNTCRVHQWSERLASMSIPQRQMPPRSDFATIQMRSRPKEPIDEPVPYAA